MCYGKIESAKHISSSLHKQAVNAKDKLLRLRTEEKYGKAEPGDMECGILLRIEVDIEENRKDQLYRTSLNFYSSILVRLDIS